MHCRGVKPTDVSAPRRWVRVTCRAPGSVSGSLEERLQQIEEFFLRCDGVYAARHTLVKLVKGTENQKMNKVTLAFWWLFVKPHPKLIISSKDSDSFKWRCCRRKGWRDCWGWDQIWFLESTIVHQTHSKAPPKHISQGSQWNMY